MADGDNEGQVRRSLVEGRGEERRWAQIFFNHIFFTPYTLLAAMIPHLHFVVPLHITTFPDHIREVSFFAGRGPSICDK